MYSFSSSSTSVSATSGSGSEIAMETFGVGTRMALPGELARQSCGSTLATALAAPVSVITIFRGALRDRDDRPCGSCRSGSGRSYTRAPSQRGRAQIPNFVIDSLQRRNDRVGRAGGGRNNAVAGGNLVLVDARHDIFEGSPLPGAVRMTLCGTPLDLQVPATGPPRPATRRCCR